MLASYLTASKHTNGSTWIICRSCLETRTSLSFVGRVHNYHDRPTHDLTYVKLLGKWRKVPRRLSNASMWICSTTSELLGRITRHFFTNTQTRYRLDTHTRICRCMISYIPLFNIATCAYCFSMWKLDNCCTLQYASFKTRRVTRFFLGAKTYAFVDDYTFACCEKRYLKIYGVGEK